MDMFPESSAQCYEECKQKACFFVSRVDQNANGTIGVSHNSQRVGI